MNRDYLPPGRIPVPRTEGGTITMSAQQAGLREVPTLVETVAGASTSAQTGTQRITGKLLATHGYVVGIEISGSGARQSVALADLNGKILQRARRPLEQVPDTHTVLGLIDDMLHEVMVPQQLHDGRVL